MTPEDPPRTPRALHAAALAALLVLAASTAAWARPPDTRPASRPRAFTHDGLTVEVPADGGRLDAFEPVAGVTDTYRCTIRTWERRLTGGGPQFGFRLRGPAGRRVHLQFRYRTGEGTPWWNHARYYMLAHDGGPYKRHPLGRNQVVTLTLGTSPVTVRRSVPFTASQFARRLQGWAAVRGVQVTPIGRSVEGRPIQRIVFGGTARRRPPTFWVLSRQHPAEASGQHVAAAFLEALLSDDPRMRALRQRVRFSCVPLMNPDGVAHLLWRFNKAGVDLNRDWKAATQPETRAVRGALEADRKADLHPAAMIDFHSTFSTFWYVPRKGALEGAAGAFLPELVKNANRRMGPQFTARLRPTFSRRVGATSAGYFIGRFRIPAATAEMAYHALAPESTAYGRALAEALTEVPVPLPRPTTRPATRPANAPPRKSVTPRP
jgi:hypothetical protein